MRTELLYLILFLFFTPSAAKHDLRMAFGSCFNHKYITIDSTIFNAVFDDKPDYFVWLGNRF